MFIVEEKADTIAITMPVLALPAAKRYVRSLINLQHRRLGYLGLRNVRKTQKIVKGIEFVDNDNTADKELDATKLCKLCKLRRPLRKITKVSARPLPDYVLDEIYVDIVKITPVTLNGDQYAALYTDKALDTRQVQTFKKKSDALKSVKSFLRIYKV